MIGIEIDASELAKAREVIEAQLKRIRPEMKLALLRAAQHATGEIRLAIQAKIERGRGGLARSFRETFLGGTGDEMSAASHSSLIYAGIQQEGGTIRPKNSKFLAIPWKSANIPPGKWPSHFAAGKLTFIPRANGRPGGFLAEVKTKAVGRGKEGPRQAARMDIKYMLVPKVTLRGKHYLEDAAESAQSGIDEILGQHAEAIINVGRSGGA